MKHLSRLLFVALLGFATPALATPDLPNKVGWPELKALILARSPALAHSQTQVAIAEAKRAWAEASPNPTLSLGAAFFVWGDEDTFDGINPEILIEQPIRLVGKAAARRRVAEAEILLSQSEVEAERLEWLLDARQTLVALAAIQAKVTKYASWLEGATTLLERLEHRHRVGATSDFELAKIRREWNEIRREQRQLTLEYEAAIRSLAAHVGAPHWRPEIHHEPIQLQPDLTGEHPLQARAQAQSAHAVALGQSADLERWPDLVIAGGVQATTDAVAVAPYLGLSIDILAFDTGKSEQLEAAAAARQAKAEARLISNQLEGARIQAQAELERAREEAKLLWSLVEADRDLQTKAETAYLAGHADLMDLIDTMRTSLQTELEAIEADFAIDLASLKLLASHGRSD